MKKLIYIIFTIFGLTQLTAQEIELSSSWVAKKASEVTVDGTKITAPDFVSDTWLQATIPGTVLTTLLNNKLVPDPFFGLNNKKISDLGSAGREEYTYWFFNRFRMADLTDDRQVWLKFRGLNYSADVFMNGKKVNEETHKGMFLREKYLITDFVEKDAVNRLAVLVTPPDASVSDNQIAGNTGIKAFEGLELLQPVADRNTGIWDKVSIEITGPVDIRDPFVKTRVPGVRIPGELQDPAFITFSADLVNPTDTEQEGELIIHFLTEEKKQKVTLAPNSTTTVTFKEIKHNSPRLWWPNGIGSPSLYDVQYYFSLDNGVVSDNEAVSFGIREISSVFDEDLGARIFNVNGQKIFIKGGNWIGSDALLRLSRERYDAEVKMHAEMNMNTIRVWGGSVTERPDFYDACDKYGILVWQDLWVTADEGKTDTQDINPKYGGDKSMLIAAVTDQIKLLRNHPSLFLWFGGNESAPPDDLNKILTDSIFPLFDGTRYYLSGSESETLFLNKTGSTVEKQYEIQELQAFFTSKSFAFNTGVGSVGMPNEISLSKIMNVSDLVPPTYNYSGDEITEKVNPVWEYHKYLGYDSFIERYGEVKSLSDFILKAQLNNYTQYRSLQEGYNAKMWNLYSGILVRGTQNPWTVLGGQLYDYFLDQNAGFYGYKHAAKPLHVQLNLDDTTICVINALPKDKNDLLVKSLIYDLHGKLLSSTSLNLNMTGNSVTDSVKLTFPKTDNTLFFVKLSITNTVTNSILDENLYWISTLRDDYKELNKLAPGEISVLVNRPSSTKASAEIRNTGSETAFFLKGVIKDLITGEQILPVYFDENYFTLMPGEKKIIEIDLYNLTSDPGSLPMILEFDGWNIDKKVTNIPSAR